eukprot:CAMPEP_0178925462 /NCGR_PEP_ID=MMETSP0786-20121207/17929_1 /TAXON_ID=186022 /ORGANISM="Thalassionema frauenfeldii, Strain CCMP 1798" /LENGTH=310 /DNA_ID=CAMNT_0020600353 /DNA_START=114 /DNA_END=1046 /DNA_ORIENTATION=-
MAAILCKGLGEICKLPCRACELICTAPCQACANICCTPLSAYAITTLVAHIPILTVGIQGILVESNCVSKQTDHNFLWLLLMVILSAIHIMAAFYLTLRIQNKNDTAMAELNSGIERASYLLCHDVGVAFYLLVWIFFVVWLSLGGIWYASAACLVLVGNNVDAVAFCMGFGWFYVVAAPCALMMSLCCTACCDSTDYTAGSTVHHPNNNSNNNNNNGAGLPTTTTTTTTVEEDPSNKKKADELPTVYTPQGTAVTDTQQTDVPVAYAEAVPATAPMEEETKNEPSFTEGIQNSMNQFMSQFTTATVTKK